VTQFDFLNSSDRYKFEILKSKMAVAAILKRIEKWSYIRDGLTDRHDNIAFL